MALTQLENFDGLQGTIKTPQRENSSHKALTSKIFYIVQMYSLKSISYGHVKDSLLITHKKQNKTKHGVNTCKLSLKVFGFNFFNNA